MLLGMGNVISIITIFVILSISSFALYFPLVLILKDYRKSLALTIPCSFSIQILFGYIFYNFGSISRYPLIYFLLVVGLNIYSLLKLRFRLHFRKFKINRHSLLVVIGVILLSLPIIFTRFYDGVTNIAPGEIDTFYHWKYLVYDLNNLGFLSSAFYPPGFHILLYPLTSLVASSDIYRFAGPVLGIIAMISIYELALDDLKNNLLKPILLLLFCLPVFNVLTLQTIGFFSSSLTFIFLPFLIYILFHYNYDNRRLLIFLYSIVNVALALTVPYLFVQYLPALFVFVTIVFIFRKKYIQDYFPYICKLFLVSIFGFLISFGHVYLQNNILKRGSGFPTINMVENLNGELVTKSNTIQADELLTNLYSSRNLSQWEKHVITVLAKNNFVKTYLLPMITSGLEIISIKNIRPINSILSVGAYSWISFCLFCSFYALKKRDLAILTIIVFSIVFGLSTQTGVLEMSNYRGRSGWYLLLFALIGSIYFLNIVINKIPKKIIYFIIGVLYISSFLKPPVYYRDYFSETFTQAGMIRDQFQNQRILFATNEKRIVILSENFYISSLSQSLPDVCQFDRCFLILENKNPDVNPILSQRASSLDRGFKVFNRQQILAERIRKNTALAIMDSPNFSKYRKYWESENVTIYEYLK